MKSGLLSTGPQSPAAPWSQVATFGPGDCGLVLAFGVSLRTGGGVCLAICGLADVWLADLPVTGALSTGTVFGPSEGLSDAGFWLGGPFDSLGFSFEGVDLPPGP